MCVYMCISSYAHMHGPSLLAPSVVSELVDVVLCRLGVEDLDSDGGKAIYVCVCEHVACTPIVDVVA